MGDGESVVGVVGDNHCSRFQVVEDGADFVPQAAPEGRIEIGEGFVEEKCSGLWSEGAGNGKALAFPTGEFVWVAAGVFFKTDH